MSKQDTTRRRIQEAFIEAYASNTFDKLSVRQLCAGLGLSRTTFYKYYDDLYEVLGEIEDRLVSDLKAINRTFYRADFHKYKDGQPFDYFYDTLNYIKENGKYFKVLLSAGKGGQFMFKWKRIIKDDFRKKYQQEQIVIKNLELVLEMIASAAIGAYAYWLFNLDIITVQDVCNDVLLKLSSDFI
ncbi:MAG TPA: hypothetical protein DCM45_01830 [Clostridiales bacterium]|nr:hypothetical protein [Clostridiales bacterium]